MKRQYDICFEVRECLDVRCGAIEVVLREAGCEVKRLTGAVPVEASGLYSTVMNCLVWYRQGSC